MSSFVNEYQGKKYYCIDDFFAPHWYGYVEMTDSEKEGTNPWSLLDFKTLEGRGGTRRVLNEDDLYPSGFYK